MKTILIGSLSGIFGSLFTLWLLSKDIPSSTLHPSENSQPVWASIPGTTLTSPILASTGSKKPESIGEKNDFSLAAAQAIPSVVYVNSISQSRASYSYWDLLFNNAPQQQISAGSGVIFQSNGYIVTNNHVIESAEKIQIIHQKKSYTATLVGADPSTDLAVLKIEQDSLPSITLGNSDQVNVGEWVLAVGNPFSLSSTVTAGIVSAKGRRINIVDDKFPIESFIQTDAAINPGNSGGALINQKGELVGINTAILSRTGSYTGYAFAVPVNIVKKVFFDIVKYGIAQKAFLGGEVEEYNFENAAKYQLNTNAKEFNGVLLTQLQRNGAAMQAGLALGDIIIQLENIRIDSKSTFEEELGYRSPGDKIRITFLRDGKEKTATITLVNKNGDTNLIKRELYEDAQIGATIEAVDNGVKIIKVKEGLFQRLNIPENYTILSINGHRTRDLKEIIDFFSRYKGRVELYGINGAKQAMPLLFYLK